jgi:hypothetical protein
LVDYFEAIGAFVSRCFTVWSPFVLRRAVAVACCDAAVTIVLVVIGSGAFGEDRRVQAQWSIAIDQRSSWPLIGSSACGEDRRVQAQWSIAIKRDGLLQWFNDRLGR